MIRLLLWTMITLVTSFQWGCTGDSSSVDTLNNHLQWNTFRLTFSDNDSSSYACRDVYTRQAWTHTQVRCFGLIAIEVVARADIKLQLYGTGVSLC
jgi:hypothetical protein